MLPSFIAKSGYCDKVLGPPIGLLFLLISVSAGSSSNAADVINYDDEIIVTAQKRSQSLSEVALSISVLNHQSLTSVKVTNIFDAIDLIPGVSSVNPGDELT